MKNLHKVKNLRINKMFKVYPRPKNEKRLPIIQSAVSQKLEEVRHTNKHAYVPKIRSEDFKYKPKTTSVTQSTSVPDIPMSNRLFEKEIIVYDKITDKWKIIKESEALKYNF